MLSSYEKFMKVGKSALDTFENQINGAKKSDVPEYII